MSRTRAVIIASVVFSCIGSVHARKNVPKDRVDVDRFTVRAVDSDSDASLGADIAPQLSMPLIRVKNVLLEAPHHRQPWPSSLLRFEVFNGGRFPLTDLVLEISVAERPERDHLSGDSLVHVLKVRGHAIVRPGYTMNYEMLLRNLSSCDCVVSVKVLSVRWLAESHL